MINLLKISVVIPTFNPGINNIQQTLNGLKNQDIPLNDWECIIVDNMSTNNTIELLDTCWHPNFKIVKEERQGLTFARIRGYREGKADLIIFVDDDNVLEKDYLSKSISLFKQHPNLGVAGGKSIGCFENDHPYWLKDFYSLIAVRPQEYPQTITTDLSKGYPPISPIGAGMVVRRSCFNNYYNYINTHANIALDRTGNNLSSGGDNEINIIALKTGFQVGYFPQLALKHIINKQRMEVNYLKKINYASNRSWVKLLHTHKISPWKPISKFGLLPRQIKAFFIYQPWKNKTNAIHFSGICGMFKGLSELN